MEGHKMKLTIFNKDFTIRRLTDENSFKKYSYFNALVYLFTMQ